MDFIKVSLVQLPNLATRPHIIINCFHPSINPAAGPYLDIANGIPIEGWLNDPQDEGLLELLPMLDSLRFTTDVRRILGLKAFSLEPASHQP